MKYILPIFVLAIFFVSFAGTANAQQYYECAVASDAAKGGVCEEYRGRVHMCQLYDGYSGGGVPSHCSDFCVERSGIPSECAVVSVRPSSNPEAHQGRAGVLDKVSGMGIDTAALESIAGEVQGRLAGIENEINTEDGIDQSEIQHVVGRIVAVIKDIVGERFGDTVSGFGEKIGDAKDNVVDKIPFVGDDPVRTDGSDEPTSNGARPKWGTDIDGDPEDGASTDGAGAITDFDPNEENPFADTGLDSVKPNEFKTDKWPDEDGTEIAKIVDAYGVERYTSDGKHFYDNPYDAAHSGEGVSNAVNTVADGWGNFKDFFFKAKLDDTDKELQREIAREVLRDTKSQSEKDVEKAYEKLSGKINTPAGGDIPAKVIIEVAKEANETDFAEGAMIYIEERKAGKSTAEIRENTSELLSGGYGTFGGGTSLSTTNKQAPAVLYARYEETYQRYLLAQKFGRTE